MRTELTAVWQEARVLECRREGEVYRSLRVAAAGGGAALPGQFHLIGFGGLDPFPADPLLLRPMSVLAADADSVSFLFKIAGRGTRMLAELQAGAPLRLLGPLGRPFTLAARPPPLLIGGGVGIPPLHFLSLALSARSIEHRVVFGFNTAAEVPVALLAKLAAEVELCTLDGSAGWHGNPVAYLEREADRPPARIQACGPEGLLAALRASRREIDELEVSLEERMACGVGVCRGCVVPVKSGDTWRYETVCREGPVFAAEELHEGAADELHDMAPVTEAVGGAEGGSRRRGAAKSGGDAHG